MQIKPVNGRNKSVKGDVLISFHLFRGSPFSNLSIIILWSCIIQLIQNSCYLCKTKNPVQFFEVKMKKTNQTSIIADYREIPSGIPGMLKLSPAVMISKILEAGDYLINNEIVIERKTNEDFIQSIIQRRLFDQCSKLRKSAYKSLLIIEGNPYSTQHKISKEAIRGALISVSVSWQIPILYTQDTSETCKVLLLIGSQVMLNDHPLARHGWKPKRIRSRQLYFLQGLPAVGPKIALSLLNDLGSLEKIINATKEELVKVAGIGPRKAAGIRNFIRTSP